MISPELLRRYPFFGFLGDPALKAIAMISEEVAFEKDHVIFEMETPAAALFLLIEGSVDHFYVMADRDNPRLRNEFYIGEINPGEIFGISAMIEPFQYTATVRATSPGRVIRIEAAGLRAVCEVDCESAYGLMRQIAKTAMDRLSDTRVQLIAARA